MSYIGTDSVVSPPHHAQAPLCTSRAVYRQGRRLTAVKVYSVCAESAHVSVAGVPALELRRELRALLTRHGRLLHLHLHRTRQHTGDYTETYMAQYGDTRTAAAAKRALDTLNWYGGSLHVCYAPERESVAETRLKLQQRRRQVAARLRLLAHSHTQGRHSYTEESLECGATTQLAVEAAGGGGGGPVRVARGKRHRIINTVLLPALPCFLPPSPPHPPPHPLRPSHPPHPPQPSHLPQSPYPPQPSHPPQTSHPPQPSHPPQSSHPPNPPIASAVAVRSVPPAHINKIRFHVKRKL